VTAVVVADASPLIALHQIGMLDLLRSEFGEVVVPPAVVREIRPSVPSLPWITERPLGQPLASRVLRASLGPGESEALSLAVELHAVRFVVDERAARRIAEGLGLSVIGTLGILLAAKRKGSLERVRPSIEALISRGFWVAPRVVERVLLAAGEDA
jgi:uncharacterized protein